MKGVEKRGNSYRITVSKGYDDKGKQIKLRTTYTPPEGASEAQIAYEIEQIRNELSEDKLSRDRMTLQTLYELWKKTVAKEDLEKSTYTDTVSRLEKVILPELGCYKLVNLTPMVIHNYLKSLRTAKRKDGKDGYAESTITRMRSMLSTVLEFGVQYGYMQANPCHSIKMRHKVRDNVVTKSSVFTPQQTKKFLEILDEPIPILLDARQTIRNGKPVTLKACDMNKPLKVALKYKLFFYIAVFSSRSHGLI